MSNYLATNVAYLVQRVYELNQVLRSNACEYNYLKHRRKTLSGANGRMKELREAKEDIRSRIDFNLVKLDMLIVIEGSEAEELAKYYQDLYK